MIPAIPGCARSIGCALGAQRNRSLAGANSRRPRHRRRRHRRLRGLPPRQGGRRRDAGRAARPEHAGVGPERRRPPRSDPARAVPAQGRAVGEGVRAVPRADAGRDPLLAGARAGARRRPRGERLRRADRRRDDAQLRDLERKAAIESAFGSRSSCSTAPDSRALRPTSPRDGRWRLLPARGPGQPAPRRTRPRSAAAALGARMLPRRRCSASDAGASASRRVPARSRPGIVDCAGAEAGDVAILGRSVRGRALAADGAATEPVPPLVEHLVYFAGGRLTLKQARPGALLIGGGWPARLDPMRPARGRPGFRSAPTCAPRSMSSRPCAGCSCCAPGRPWSTAPTTGGRSWASCRAYAACSSACSRGSASAPARSRPSRRGALLGREPEGGDQRVCTGHLVLMRQSFATSTVSRSAHWPQPWWNPIRSCSSRSATVQCSTRAVWPESAVFIRKGHDRGLERLARRLPCPDIGIGKDQALVLDHPGGRTPIRGPVPEPIDTDFGNGHLWWANGSLTRTWNKLRWEAQIKWRH